MCICKIPPVPQTLTFYFVIAAVFYQFLQVYGIYFLRSERFRMNVIGNCPRFPDDSVILNVEVRNYDGNRPKISGNLSFPFAITDEIKITIQGMRLKEGEWSPDKIYVNERSLCGIIDNWMREASDLSRAAVAGGGTACPVPAGLYELQKTDFERIQFPYETFGYVQFRVQLKNEQKMLMCKDFQVSNFVAESS